jgi:hypothetical protein
MKIDNLLVHDGSVDYYNESFRNTLEALIPTYRASAKTTVQDIPANYAVVYNADFFGLLLALRLDPCYHWFTMRLNNMYSPYDFNESITSIMVPNRQDLEAARQSWRTTQVIKT